MAVKRVRKTTDRKAPRRRPTRGYSREFRPRGAGADYTLRRIPSAFWRTVKAKAQREGVSLRATILTYLRKWAAQ